jgi:hypothetical protein
MKKLDDRDMRILKKALAVAILAISRNPRDDLAFGDQRAMKEVFDRLEPSAAERAVFAEIAKATLDESAAAVPARSAEVLSASRSA